MGQGFSFHFSIGLLREVNSSQPKGEMEVVSACDPLNVVGILTPGDRVPAVLGNRVVFRDGVPLASIENGNIVNRAAADEATMRRAYSLLWPSGSGLAAAVEPSRPGSNGHNSAMMPDHGYDAPNAPESSTS